MMQHFKHIHYALPMPALFYCLEDMITPLPMMMYLNVPRPGVEAIQILTIMANTCPLTALACSVFNDAS
jgi:hypothetical protein